MELFEHAEEDVLLFRSRVDEATRLAAQTMRDSDALKTRKGRKVRTHISYRTLSSLTGAITLAWS